MRCLRPVSCFAIRLAALVAVMAVGLVDAAGLIAAERPPLGVADTMEKIPADAPWTRPAPAEALIEAARNEVEGVQLIVPAGKADLRGATVQVGPLSGPGGATIPAACVTWNVVGYVETEKPEVRSLPDPLLPDRTFEVRAGRVQPIWVNVRVPEGTPPGEYRGTLRVVAPSEPARALPLVVRVWNVTVPRQQHLETCFPLYVHDLQQFYRKPKLPIEWYERWIDFCLDHRISVNLSDWPEFAVDMDRLVSRQLGRGGSAFCLGYGWFSQGAPADRKKHNAEQIARLRPLYERAKRNGWLDRAYIYCHDEIGKEQFTFAHELYSELKKALPGLRLMQTFYKDNPVAPLDDVLDIWAPNTARYRKDEFQAQQAKGDRVWWYVCCGPGKPFANLMIGWPAIDHRVLLWQNQKFRVQGFLYWGMNVWRDNLKGAKRWPEVRWDPATWRNDAGVAHYGDGQLLYPGPEGMPLSSIRLENLRDGIEDFEYFWLLGDAVARLKKAGRSADASLIAEADKLLAVDDVIVADITHFTSDPKALRAARAKLAAMIQRLEAAGK